MASKITLCNNHKFLSKLKSTLKGRLLQHFIQDLKIRGYQEIFPNFSLGIFSLGINSNQEQMKVFTRFRGFYLILGCYVIKNLIKVKVKSAFKLNGTLQQRIISSHQHEATRVIGTLGKVFLHPVTLPDGKRERLRE